MIKPQLKKQLTAKLEEINLIIQNKYKTHANIGMLAGLSGLAVFEFEYAKYKNSDEEAEIGSSIINECVNQLNTNNQLPTYCSGIAGFGWALEYLSEKDYIEINNDEFLQELDHYLFSCMQKDFQINNYDFLHGGIGYGFYFLKRFHNTKSKELKSRYKDYLKISIEELEKISENGDTHTVKWLSTLNYETGKKGYNLSLSHGMSSIVNYLSRVYSIKDFQPKIEKMLNGAINYILSLENKNSIISRFPSWVDPEEKINYNSRVAWCYGDLGLGYSLFKASIELRNNELRERSIDILKHTASRRKDENTFIKDAGVCHGSYGNAQIFLSLYNETKIDDFREAAIFWLQKGIDMAVHPDGYSGYKQWKKDEWSAEIIVLEGIAGIGLTIIDFLSDSTIKWDESLLIN